MTRLYLRVFLTFWCVTAVIIVTTNLIVHWQELSPRHQLNESRATVSHEPAHQLLKQMVGSVVNRNSAQLLDYMRNMPPWSKRFFYIVDANNDDLLGRPLPEGVEYLVPRLNPSQPFDKVIADGRKTWGRHVTLNDGTSVKMFTVSAGRGTRSSGDIVWQLFINNIWPLLLTSILVSGTACFFVARHLSRGVYTLQKATRQIAGGDLSVRISRRFDKRRDEIASLAHDFDHMTERLEKAMQEQKRLIKDVSHELRTPLARLHVALALAQQRSQGAVDKELERIKQAADYLNDVISDILAIPVLDEDGWSLDDTVDLNALLSALCAALQSDAHRADIRLHLRTGPDEALVATHGNMLVGVFDNVIRNAMRYTPAGGAISVRLSEGDGRYQVAICDTGPGVDPEQLTDIFQPFYRTDQARDRESGGYGLGLAIAQRTVALHKGDIHAANRDSGGLCITIDLPASNNHQ